MLLTTVLSQNVISKVYSLKFSLSPLDEEQTESTPTSEVQAQTDALLDGAAVCEQGLKKVTVNRRVHLTLATFFTLLQLVYLALLSLDITPGGRVALGTASLIGMLFLAYFLFMGTVFFHGEYNGVKATKLAIKCHLEKLKEKNAKIFEEERKRSLSFIK